MDKILDFADCDLVVSDAITGVRDYSMNLKLARKLQDLAKTVDNMSSRLNLKAKHIIKKVEHAKDHKASIQPVQFVEEVTDPKLKDDKTKKKPAKHFKPSTDFHIKTEWLDPTSSEDEDR